MNYGNDKECHLSELFTSSFQIKDTDSTTKGNDILPERHSSVASADSFASAAER